MTAVDRRALTERHDVRRTTAAALEPLSVGNGEFAFTADVTGLQTLPAFHAEGMRLGTHAQWAWHSAPNPHGFTLDDVYEDYSTPSGQLVPYATTGAGYSDSLNQPPRADGWLRENPHKLDLGRIGFARTSGAPIEPADISAIQQHLRLWHGRMVSEFRLDGVAVRVQTVCHPDHDVLAIRVESALLADDLGVALRFPYAVGDWHDPSVWDRPDDHVSAANVANGRCDIARQLDDDRYHVAVQATSGRFERRGPHEFLARGEHSTLDVVVAFAPEPVTGPLPSVDAVIDAASRSWSRFWSTGGAVDLAGSSDPRAAELERRVVLSQYLTAIHCAGSMPPAETGLVTNSWRGKFHLEMHWWHAAHFPLWGRAHLLERSMAWYERMLHTARGYAQRQGYQGARWPKQVGPEGRESPSNIGAFLIWQQPHPIYYAELLWRSGHDRTTLERFADIVFETAGFMASFPWWDTDAQAYCLGPPLASAQEKAAGQRREARNPAFELAYWAWALGVAQEWRVRLGLEPVPAWEAVARQLAALPIRAGRYRELEHPSTFDEGHPTMVGALGFVPDTGVVDHSVMRQTVKGVLDSWDWSDTWGWDYPLLAMTACRLGEPELAVDALLLETQKNTYLENGHNFQELPKLALYLPGNGGLLYATAMMAGGWDGAPDRATPGFPRKGWQVAAEGLRPAP